MGQIIEKASFLGGMGGHNGYQMSLHRVLLAEDDFDDQLFAEKELERSRYVGKVTCFPNGQELLQYLRYQALHDSNFLHMAPITIILDLDMPMMNGFEVLQRIKADSRFKDISVIVVTGEQNRWDMEKALSFEADAVLKKPMDVGNLDRFFEEQGKKHP